VKYTFAHIAMLCIVFCKPPSPGLTLDGKVVRVVDGDTIVVESRVRYHVRLIDCWAPESRTLDAAEKARGIASKARMIELTTGQTLRVSIPLTGDFTDATTMSRVLGRAWLEDGRELSEVMVAEGLATKTKVHVP
jgi:endonuclease YncB( thermonuclease family)